MRQHAPPIIRYSGGDTWQSLGSPKTLPEIDLQSLIHDWPSVLPISEIDESYADPISVCTELGLPSGSADNLLVTPAGRPILVECKLWRNPQARREVVGQVLDYISDLISWTSSDIDRVVRQRYQTTLTDFMRSHVPELDEATFHDTLSRSLQKGRIMVLVVGDGIREGTEAIFQYLEDFGSFQGTFGLVELPIYALPSGGELALPRVLARALTHTRISWDSYAPTGIDAVVREDAVPNGKRAWDGDEFVSFWSEFLSVLTLDDPEQPVPRPPRQGYMSFLMPVSGGACWLNVYRVKADNRLGLFLSYTRDSDGEAVNELLLNDADALLERLGEEAKLQVFTGDARKFGESFDAGDLEDAAQRRSAFMHLSERLNAYVNVLRPAIKSAMETIEARRT